jgi:preprotein translocase subunit YajC
MTAVLTLVGPLLGATAKKQSGSPILLILLVVGAAFYFLIYRPQQRKAKLAREAVQAFEVGDEVLTAGGIVGYIIDIDGDRVTLETSVGASFVVLRPYVLRKLEEPVAPDADSGAEGEAEEFEDHEAPDGETDHDGAAEADADADADDQSADDQPAGRKPKAGGGPSEAGEDSGGPDGPARP